MVVGDSRALLVRSARLVEVGPVAAPTGASDVRVEGGRVTEVAPTLAPGPDDLVVEAEGRWLMPGLWDQHVHLGQWAATSTRLDLTGTSCADDVLALVKAAVASAPGETGILEGYGHRTASWPVQPSVAALDDVSAGRPVVLMSGDAHHGWLNTAALRLLGLPSRERVVEESEWFALTPRITELTADPARTRVAYAGVIEAALRRGVVGVTEMEWADNAQDWAARSASGLARLRVRTATYAAGLADILAAGVRTGDVLDEAGLVTMGPLKIISDGSLNTRTAFCHEPYAGADGLAHPRGYPNNSPEELTALLAEARAGGLSAAVHAIGDAAAGIALDAFAATGARGSVEHAQLMTRADIRRMGELGVVASVQPAHLVDDRDATMQCWPDRVERCFALRSMVDAGVRLALGSDAPVAPLDPWLAMAAAVHRGRPDDLPWVPGESLTVAEALAASTDGQTTVAPGSRGDLVLLDADPLDPAGGDPAEQARWLAVMPVAATVVAGALVAGPLADHPA